MTASLAPSAIRALSSRVETLRERGKRKRLTPVEQRELEESIAALHELEASPGDLTNGNRA